MIADQANGHQGSRQRTWLDPLGVGEWASGSSTRFAPGASKSKNRAGAAPGTKWESNGRCAPPPQVDCWASHRNGHLRRAREAWRGKVTSPRGIQEWRAASSPELSANIREPQMTVPQHRMEEGSLGCYVSRYNVRETHTQHSVLDL